MREQDTEIQITNRTLIYHYNEIYTFRLRPLSFIRLAIVFVLSIKLCNKNDLANTVGIFVSALPFYLPKLMRTISHIEY
jgi:hypothetical protein